MVVPRISNPNSREALNRHSIKSFTPPLADHNIDSVALALLSDSSRLGLRRRKEETHAGTHRANLISNSSFTARFGRGITQATTPIWFVPHHGDPRRNHHVGTRQGWPQQNCLRAPSTRADTALPARQSALPRPCGPTGSAGQIPARACPQGIRGLPQMGPLAGPNMAGITSPSCSIVANCFVIASRSIIRRN